MGKLERGTCPKCGKNTVRLQNCWKQKNGEYYPVCRSCLTANVDVQKPQTFLWILKEFDVPFIEHVWVNICKKSFAQDPVRFNAASVMGKYLRTMFMNQYHDMVFDDTYKLAKEQMQERKMYEEAKNKLAQIVDNFEKLQTEEVDIEGVPEDLHMLEGKELVEKAQQNTVTEEEKPELEKEMNADINIDIPNFVQPTIVKKKRGRPKSQKTLEKERRLAELNKDVLYVPAQLDVPTPIAAQPQYFAQQQPQPQPTQQVATSLGAANLQPVDYAANPMAVDEQAILNQLSRNEIQELALKWGSNFLPSEWIKMEEMYNKYSNEFEISVDREESLIALCITSIKMKQALQAGDAQGASRFSSMFDQLRKSSAFTEAQKKEDKKAYVSSIGELVAAVEREGGIIPKFDYQFEVQPDKVDLTLKDNQAYLYNLVKNEMGLGDLIESYIEKLDAAEKQRQEDADGMNLQIQKQEEDDEEYAERWSQNLEDNVASEMDAFFAKIGDA